MSDDVPRIIASALAEDPSVMAVYLYGSRATDRARPDSDWDVAVLLDRDPRPDTFGVEADLLDRVHARLPGIRVEIATLNGASPFWQYVVIVTGRVLFDRDPNRRLDYETLQWNRWLDFKPYWDRMVRAMHRRIQDGTYGRLDPQRHLV